MCDLNFFFKRKIDLKFISFCSLSVVRKEKQLTYNEDLAVSGTIVNTLYVICIKSGYCEYLPV